MRLGIAVATLSVLATVLAATPVADATFPHNQNARIAFTGTSPIGHDIYTVRPDGAGQRRLTFSGNVYGARFDASGRRLAFTYQAVFSKDIWVMLANGADKTKVIAGPADEWQPAWSPDGESLAYTSSATGRKQVYLYEIATGESRQLTFASEGLTAAWSPAWSPDGTRIAFVGRIPSGLDENVEFYYPFWHVVMTVSPEGNDLQQLTYKYFAIRPDWTPTSRRILYTNYGESYRNYCPRPTYSVAADGSDGTTLVRAGINACREFDAVRSPAGGKIALWSDGPSVDGEGGNEPGLYVARADGTNAVRIAQNIVRGMGVDWKGHP